MTRTARVTATLTAALLVPALMVLTPMKALANPNFGNADFQTHLQQDLGMFGPDDHGRNRPCPTVRRVPVPRSWGREWWPANDWVQYTNRRGHPPNGNWPASETPDQKWRKTVKRYRAFLLNHRYDGTYECHVRHQHMLEYLEQNYYNYWHRLRYGQNPRNHTSNYYGWGFGNEGW